MSLTHIDSHYWTDRTGRAMGSRAHIVVGDAPPGTLEWAFAELERLEQCWSRFRHDSELAYVNTCTGEWVDVSAPMLLVLTCASDLYRMTRGAFDPTIIDALEEIGYDASFERVAPETPETPALLPARGFNAVDIDVQRARVRLPRGTRLDFGGIGKGLAVDLVARGLVDRGVRSALVEVGGDLRVRGEPPAPDGAWIIPVEHPLDPSSLAFRIRIADGALVTSTTQMRAWQRGGRRYHHLVDPATGDSARTGIAAVVATATDAWRAEGVAKAVVIAGAGAGLALAAEAGVRAWLFSDEGRVFETEAGE
jgi:thiamine biosynthesis lipoprotein